MNVEEIAKHIKQIAHGKNAHLPTANGKSFVAEVVSVTEQYCTIKYADATFTEVQLLAIIDEDNDNVLLIQPKVGSKVLVSCMDGSMNNMYVVKVQEAGLIRFKSADVVFEVNMATGKFTIKNSSTSLFEIIADLITEVKTLKVFTPSGPSGTALPLNVVRLNAIKTKLNTLLN